MSDHTAMMAALSADFVAVHMSDDMAGSGRGRVKAPRRRGGNDEPI